MRVLITLTTFGLGGTESYTATVAEQLERLGHPVRVHAQRIGSGGRELAAARGLRLTVGDHELGGLADVDALIAQDLGSAYLLAARDGLRRIFVTHGLAPFEAPADVAGTVVVLNDRMLGRVRASAAGVDAVRLRQPVDLDRFRPKGANRPRARRLLALSNSLTGDHLRMLESACADLGLEMVRVGGAGNGSAAPEQAIAGADVVVGYGRSVLEAMAMGKAAYVWERAGGDGWVTPESYPALEADGFSGAATDAVIDAERMRADLAAYTPELGVLGYDLARTHHVATKHAEALVGLLEADGEGSPKGEAESMEVLAMMVRAQNRVMAHAHGLEVECARLREAIEAQRQSGLDAEARLQALTASRSWRMTAPLRRIGARIRANLKS